MRRFKTISTVATYAVLGAAALIVLLLPENLGVPAARAQGTRPSIEITGTVRDFRRGHPDFGVLPDHGTGTYAGNVSLELMGNGIPVYAGPGFKIVEPWRERSNRPVAPHLSVTTGLDQTPISGPCEESVADLAGRRGPASTGGISSAGSFAQWFANNPDTNRATSHTIRLTERGGGIYEYLNDAFFPVDGRLFGNQGANRNHDFTYAFATSFTYRACEDQFIQLQSSDDAWVYIDGRLVIDLGGVESNAMQYAPIDRLGLADGETYTVHLFYAHRNGTASRFRLWTNVIMGDPSG
jgi:fibro-slime domain-containing protein